MTYERQAESFDAKALNTSDLHSSISVADTKGVFAGLNDSAQKAAITLEKQGVLPGLTISGIDSIKNPESGMAVGDTAKKIENYSKDLSAAMRNGGIEGNAKDSNPNEGGSKDGSSKDSVLMAEARPGTPEWRRNMIDRIRRGAGRDDVSIPRGEMDGDMPRSGSDNRSGNPSDSGSRPAPVKEMPRPGSRNEDEWEQWRRSVKDTLNKGAEFIRKGPGLSR